MKANFSNSVLKVVMVYTICFWTPACSTNGNQAGDSGAPPRNTTATLSATLRATYFYTETNAGPRVTGADSENQTSTDANTDSYSDADTDSYSDTNTGATTAWYGQGIAAALEKCRFLNNETGIEATDGEIDVVDAWFESNAQGIDSRYSLSLNGVWFPY